jgi:regulator of sigma E protease
LDGGHIAFLLWEVVTRRKPSDAFLERAQIVGMTLLIALLLYANFNDIYRFLIK